MPDINEEVVFEVGANGIEFHTKTDGDLILIRGLSLTAEQAASLTWLVNQGEDVVLEFEVKAKPEA